VVKTLDKETRKRAVLATAINRYIKNPVPVASDEIAREFNVSSATIRNVFAELEADGYLMHPHTSAGRIPTDKGYRYYVDFLLSQLELLDDEKQKIICSYKREITKLEDVLEKTSDLVSRATHYASIVSFLDWQDRYFYRGVNFVLEQPEFQDLTKMRLLIRMIEEKQDLLDIINRDFKEKEKVKIYIGQELGVPDMGNCSLIVSSYKINDKPVGRLAILGPTRMEYNHIIPTLEYVSNVLSDVLDEI